MALTGCRSCDERDSSLAARVSDYYVLNHLLRERYDRHAGGKPLPFRLQQRSAVGFAALRRE
jgi:hypothetical protein